MTAVMDNPTTEAAAPAATYALVSIDQIVPAPDNVRTDLGDLTGLVASIRSVGLIEPLALERCTSNDHAGDHGYHILAGERRWTAARQAGLLEVPSMVRDAVVDDGARVELMLIENLQRQDLHPMEEARGYQRLAEMGLSQRTIAERVGCSQAHVSRRVALLELPPAVQTEVDAGGITVADAHELLKLKDHPKELAAAAKETHDVPRAVQSRVHEISAEAKLRELTEAARRKGWAVVKPPTRYGDKQTHWRVTKPGTYSYGSDVQVDPAKHRKEPCHGVELRKGYQGKVEQVDVCTDRDRHKAKGASDLKVPKQERRTMTASERKAKEQARLRSEAGKRRGEALAGILAGRIGGDTPLALALVCEGIVPECHAETLKVACELLGVEPVKAQWGGHDYAGPLLARARRSGADTLKVGLACALAAAECSARFPHHSWKERGTRQLYAFLEHNGYEPDEYERSQMADNKEAVREFNAGDVRVLSLEDGVWRVVCDHCGERDEDEEIVVERPTKDQALAFRALHLTDAHGIRACRVCSCTEDRACAGGCSWADEDLCSACVAGAADDEPATFTVAKAGRKWKVTCSTCGELGTNTTEAYANERGAAHLSEDHHEEVPA